MISILVIIGVVLWLVNTKIPMDSTFKTVINVVVILGVCLWLLSAFGVIPASAMPPSFTRADLIPGSVPTVVVRVRVIPRCVHVLGRHWFSPDGFTW